MGGFVKPILIIYKIGSWSYILVGLAHLNWALFSPDTAEKIEIIQTLKGISISVPGTESNLYLFHEGFSLMMGVLLLGYGLLNLSIIRKSKTIQKDKIILNIVVSLIALIISIKHFFIVPVIFLGIAFFCFSTLFILSSFSKNKT